MQLKKKAEKVDIVLCAGDISLFGNGLNFILKKIDMFNKPILLIHGNHESERMIKKACRKFRNIVYIHKKIYKINNVAVIGYGGGGFSMADHNFTKFGKTALKRIKILQDKDKDLKTILLTHAPPYKTRLDKIGKDYCGSRSITDFIRKAKPNLVIAGHIHENFYKTDRIGKTLIINPGPGGMMIKL